MKAVEDTVWRGNWVRFGLTIIITAAVAWLIWNYGHLIDLDTSGLKWLGFAGALILVLFIRHGGIVRQASRYWLHLCVLAGFGNRSEPLCRHASSAARHGSLRTVVRCHADRGGSYDNYRRSVT